MKTDPRTVLVLGGSGMLGSMVVDVLARNPALRVVAGARDERFLERAARAVPEATWRHFSFETESDVAQFIDRTGPLDWAINAAGVTNSPNRFEQPDDMERLVVANSLLPYWVGKALPAPGRVIGIATDGVYSGSRGGYREPDAHDPPDAYGAAKSLGEAQCDSTHWLRTSIVGPESGSGRSLLEWLLHLPHGAQVAGFTNHLWNGVTTLHFAKVCSGIVAADSRELPGLQHLLPADRVNKHSLLELIADSYGRSDISIIETCADRTIDRTLDTDNAALNRSLWHGAGYANGPPPIAEMIGELADFDYRLRA